MISVNITTALLIYLSSILLFLLILWLFSFRKEKKKKMLPHLYDLVICEYCHYAYLGLTEAPVSRCPQCSSFNKKHKKSE